MYKVAEQSHKPPLEGKGIEHNLIGNFGSTETALFLQVQYWDREFTQLQFSVWFWQFPVNGHTPFERSVVFTFSNGLD